MPQGNSEIVEWIYFKSMVPYGVGVRFFPRDPDGVVLNASDPYVNIRKENYRDFVRANQRAIEKGLIKEVPEPDLNFVNDNTMEDSEVEELVKNLFMLKKKLPQITSEGVLGKIYAEAKRQKRAPKIIELIEDRIEELTPPHLRGRDWSAEVDNNGGE